MASRAVARPGQADRAGPALSSKLPLVRVVTEIAALFRAQGDLKRSSKDHAARSIAKRTETVTGVLRS